MKVVVEMKDWFLKLFNKNPKDTSTYLKYEDGEVIPLKTTNKSKLKDDLIEEEKQSQTVFREDELPKTPSFGGNRPTQSQERKKKFSKVIMLIFIIVIFASFCQLFYYFLSKNTTVINSNHKIDSITKSVKNQKEAEPTKKTETSVEDKSVSKTDHSEKENAKTIDEKPIFSFGQKDLKVKSMTDERKSLLSLSSDTHNFILDSLLNLKSEVIFYEKGKSNKYIFTNETDRLAQRINNAKSSLQAKEKELSNEDMSSIFTNLNDRLIALDILVQTLRAIDREQIIDTTNDFIEKENNTSTIYQDEFKKVLDSYGVTYKTDEGKITYAL
ncbi:hypothetical protein AT268_33295 [Bacillus cereus]|uniref:Uncharacterized protein n=2 Tax=Bacillaceae TaxID=186817 RepID=A0A9X0MKS8_BACCE|nr:hypothetical protein AT268_33295 [Bacillus cereus]